MKNKIIEITKMPKFILILFVLQLILVSFILQKNNKLDLEFIYILIPVSFLLFFAKMKIELSITSIRYKLFPIHFSYKEIEWSEVQKLQITKIDALTDFAGWGFRYSKKYGWGYIFGSDYALFLTLNSNKKITISIKDKENIMNFFKENNIPFQFN